MKTKNKFEKKKIAFEFVEFMPDELEENVLYLSLKYATAKHRCFCGCGSDVVTPISPVGWQVIFDGETMSLHPSIGNWNFLCRSHYWITRNMAVPARSMSRWEIEEGRESDRQERDVYFEGRLAQGDAHDKGGDSDDEDEGKSWIFGHRRPKSQKDGAK